MSKTIKLEDQVYYRLEELRAKRETFSQAVARVLRVVSKVEDVTTILYPGDAGREYQHGPEKTRDLQVR